MLRFSRPMTGTLRISRRPAPPQMGEVGSALVGDSTSGEGPTRRARVMAWRRRTMVRGTERVTWSRLTERRPRSAVASAGWPGWRSPPLSPRWSCCCCRAPYGALPRWSLASRAWRSPARRPGGSWPTVASCAGCRSPARPREHAAAPQQRPFVIMNPRSGGGKVAKFGLADKAAALGAEVALLEGPGIVDVAALARHAVDGGADLLGGAGGDGTQALVAGIAAGRDIPMLVISAGTRNHFALDLGLDRDDPSTCLDALTDGVELRIDLGLIGDRTFVNNASFGGYAQVVQSPAYRDEKTSTALAMLPDLLTGHQGAHLIVRADGQVILDGPQAVLVSNNPYETGDIAGLGRRARLDQGVLGVVGVKVGNAVQAAGLLRRPQRSRSLTVLTAREVVIDADQPQIPVGIDGESVLMPTPVRCTIRPLSLRV